MRAERGFSLLELLITLLIIGVVAAVALPTYQNHLTKTRRSDAFALLLEASQLQERYYTESMSYASTMTGLGYGADPMSSENGQYTVTVLGASAAATVLGGSCPISTCYVLEATPTAAQAGDGKLAIASTGQKFWDENNDGDYGDSGENDWNQ